MMSTGRSRFPFTASQWQELEHQALIFKYMVSGMPIPSDLLYTIGRSLDSSLSPKLVLHQPQHVGWNCFQMGFGRKIDPDPGRCRRTDGKKWRCSKEAYADSKYCERHMHRGRNRSRKPVEVMTTTATPTIAPSTNASTRPTPTAISISLNIKNSDHSSFNPISHSISSVPFGYPHSSSSRPPGIGFSSQENTNFLLESSPYSHAGKDYRNSYGHGMKEVGENTFLSEASGNMRSMSMSGSSVDDSWQLTMGAPLGHLNHRGYSDLQSEQSYLQLHSLDDTSRQRQYQNYYNAPNSDVKSDDQPKKVMHHFFDEWPPKDKDSWLDSEDKLSINDLSLSKTQLSISMPNSSHDFFMSQNDK